MGHITFITGGARSGKSDYAITLAANAKKCAFLATCEALDKEMDDRIKLHKSSRPKNWLTFEEPLNVASAAKKIPSGCDFIIIDCLTLLVTNLMMKNKSNKEIEREVRAMIKALKDRRNPCAIVSNEVGLGIVPDNRLARDFRDIAGRINRITAESSDNVILMVSGIPWTIK